MRPLALAILTLVLSAIPAAQSKPDQSILWITIKQTTPTASGSQPSAAIGAARTAAYTGGPWASVPARPIKPDTETTASQFRIRAWKPVGEPAARVALVAVSRDTSDREIEIPMAMFAIEAGQSVDVKDTEKYGAVPITLSATLGPPKS